jgi:hypothetical protein
MQPNRKEEMLAEAPGPSLLDRIAEETAGMGARYMPTLTVKQYVDREKMILELKAMLVEDTDYGTIPGTEKPTLYQAGAQKICAFFGYVPSYALDVEIEDWDGSKHGGEPLFYYRWMCTLLKDGKPVGQCPGSCNSWEAKYRFRVGKRVCPSCGIAALIEGKQWKPTDPKQWVCYGKKGGCGSKFDANDTRITSQSVGRVANPDFADIINTVQKIGAKRAYVGACLSATGASQYFSADLEDMPAEVIGNDAPRPAAKESAAPAEKTTGYGEPGDDVALTMYLARLKSGKDTEKVYKEINDRIKKLSNRETVNEEWAKAASAKNASPTAIVRHMYGVLEGLTPPEPAEPAPADPQGGAQAPSEENDANEDFKSL